MTVVAVCVVELMLLGKEAHENSRLPVQRSRVGHSCIEGSAVAEPGPASGEERPGIGDVLEHMPDHDGIEPAVRLELLEQRAVDPRVGEALAEGPAVGLGAVDQLDSVEVA